MVSRAPFGINGNRVVSFFNWLTQVGFEIEGIVLVVLVAVAMFVKGGIGVGTGLKAILIVRGRPDSVHSAVPRPPMITRLLRYLSYVFIVLFVIMAVLVIPMSTFPTSISQARGRCGPLP